MVGAFRHFASEAMAKEMDLKNYDITQTELLKWELKQQLLGY